MDFIGFILNILAWVGIIVFGSLFGLAVLYAFIIMIIEEYFKIKNKWKNKGVKKDE